MVVAVLMPVPMLMVMVVVVVMVVAVIGARMAVLMTLGMIVWRIMRVFVPDFLLDPFENPVVTLVHAPASKVELPQADACQACVGCMPPRGILRILLLLTAQVRKRLPHLGQEFFGSFRVCSKHAVLQVVFQQYHGDPLQSRLHRAYLQDYV